MSVITSETNSANTVEQPQTNSANTVEQNAKPMLFESTIEEVKEKQKSLLYQIWIFGGFSISIILGLLYRVFTS